MGLSEDIANAFFKSAEKENWEKTEKKRIEKLAKDLSKAFIDFLFLIF